MTDRRRVNAPSGGTLPRVYGLEGASEISRPHRSRAANELRKTFLKTGLTPSASGSSYLEVEQGESGGELLPVRSALKLSCTVHGPKPLPRSVPFSPTLVLSTHVKYAPFATRERKGYIQEIQERDLAAHLETALQGAIIGHRWPKSGVDVVITVLEGEEDQWWADQTSDGPVGLSNMTVLAGCITAASAALVDAGIDCVDLVVGGTAVALAESPSTQFLIDPAPIEHQDILSACLVGYLPSRDEITELWLTSTISAESSESQQRIDDLVDNAVAAARGNALVLSEALKETASRKLERQTGKAP